MLDTGFSVCPLVVQYLHLFHLSFCPASFFSFSFFVLFSLSILFPLCGSELIHWKLNAGAMLISLTIVWVRKPYYLIGRIFAGMHCIMHMFLWVSICVAECKCVSQTLPRSADLGFIWVIRFSNTHRLYCLWCWTRCSQRPF